GRRGRRPLLVRDVDAQAGRAVRGVFGAELRVRPQPLLKTGPRGQHGLTDPLVLIPLQPRERRQVQRGWGGGSGEARRRLNQPMVSSLQRITTMTVRMRHIYFTPVRTPDNAPAHIASRSIPSPAPH